MQLEHRFQVAADPGATYALLTDVERIAPCMPGAQLQEIEGDEYRGVVKVKVGPISTQYKGTATFVERNVPARSAVIKASGRDTRGQGNANATITLTVADHSEGANVSVITNLNITGKVAQLGRGAIADVSSKLLDQFVESLEALIAGLDAPSPGKPAAKEAPAERRVVSHPEPEPVALLSAAGPALARRVVPVLLGLLAILFFWRRRVRHRSDT